MTDGHTVTTEPPSGARHPRTTRKAKPSFAALPRLFTDTPPPFRHLGVIFGDPSLPDMVKPDGKFSASDLADVTHFLKVFETMPEYQVTVFDHHATLVDDLLRVHPDMVINLCDNGYNNNPRLEMHVPALLEMLGLPYTGCGPEALLMAYDKALVSAAAAAIGVPVPKEYRLRYGAAFPKDWNSFPAFVKPNLGDNSFGITENAVCMDMKQLKKTVANLQHTLPGTDLLIQEFLPGKEYRVTMLGNKQSGYHFLPIRERDYSAVPDEGLRFATIACKYGLDAPETKYLQARTARLDRKTEALLKNATIALAERLHCRDFIGIDFRADVNGVLKVIDVNPNPSWDRYSLFEQTDIHEHYSYESIIRFIVESAQCRYLHMPLASSAVSAVALLSAQPEGNRRHVQGT